MAIATWKRTMTPTKTIWLFGLMKIGGFSDAFFLLKILWIRVVFTRREPKQREKQNPSPNLVIAHTAGDGCAM